MGHIARMKSTSGGQDPHRVVDADVVSNALEIPDSHNSVSLLFSSTATVTTLNASDITLDGRRVYFRGEIGTAAVTFTNNNDTTTKGQMDLGGSNIAVDDNDTLCLQQKADGSWIRLNEEATN